jgi:hypothetical protein
MFAERAVVVARVHATSLPWPINLSAVSFWCCQSCCSAAKRWRQAIQLPTPQPPAYVIESGPPSYPYSGPGYGPGYGYRPPPPPPQRYYGGPPPGSGYGPGGPGGRPLGYPPQQNGGSGNPPQGRPPPPAPPPPAAAPRPRPPCTSTGIGGLVPAC